MSTDLNHDEQALHDFLERSMAETSPSGERLRTGAMAQGRRLRTRRRLTTALTCAAASAVAAVVVPAAFGGSSPRAGEVATDTPPAQVQVTPWPAAKHWWDMPSSDVLSRLEPLLPDGTTVKAYELAPEDRAPGEPAESQGWLRTDLVAADGTTGGLEVLFYDPETPVTPSSVTSTDAAGNVTTQAMASSPSYASRIACPRHTRPALPVCTELTDASGAHVGRASTSLDGDFVIHEVTLLGPDGALVYVATANSTDEKWGSGYHATAGAQPPLDLAQVRTIAESDAWTDWTPPAR